MNGPIIADVFPARITVPTGVLDQARVITDGDTLWVFTRQGGRPVLAATGKLTEFDPVAATRRATWTATDADGHTYQVTPGGGCGCGNVLKGISSEALLSLAG